MLTHGAFPAAVPTRWRGTLSRTTVDVKTLAFLTQPHIFVHVTLESLDLAQDPLQLQLVGLASWTFVCSWIKTDLRDIVLPEQGEAIVLDRP